MQSGINIKIVIYIFGAFFASTLILVVIMALLMRPASRAQYEIEYEAEIFADAVSESIVGAMRTAEKKIGGNSDQSIICEVDSPFVLLSAKHCKNGQKIVLFGNQNYDDQSMLAFAASACDMRHAIVLTKSGVACIYNPINAGKISTHLSPSIILHYSKSH